MATNTREFDKYKRQIGMLEAYIRGRLQTLDKMYEDQPAQAEMNETAIAELGDLLTHVIPEMRKVQA